VCVLLFLLPFEPPEESIYYYYYTNMDFGCSWFVDRQNKANSWNDLFFFVNFWA